MSTDIPIIDFDQVSLSPHTVAGQLIKACADWGFFYVKNHPIPQDDIDGMFELSRNFFSQDLAIKSLTPYIPSYNAGYKPASSYSASGQFTDPREAFGINKWPSSNHASSAALPPILNSSRAQIRAFQQKVLAFTSRLLELIALALGLPLDQFTSKHDPQKENFDNFELMRYPPILKPDPTRLQSEHSQESRHPIRFRISPHTDWGTLTLLFQSTVSGLEVRPPQYTNPALSLESEKWTPAPAIRSYILINIGDMLEFWTAGRLKSTWHRVVPVQTEAGYGVERYSFAYFLHPDRDAMLVPMKGMEREGWTPRYEGVGRTAEEHICARIEAVHGLGSRGEAGRSEKSEELFDGVNVVETPA